MKTTPENLLALNAAADADAAAAAAEDRAIAAEDRAIAAEDRAIAAEAENSRLRHAAPDLLAALEDIARGDYSDPLCMRTPEQRAREALAKATKEKP